MGRAVARAKQGAVMVDISQIEQVGGCCVMALSRVRARVSPTSMWVCLSPADSRQADSWLKMARVGEWLG